MTDGATNAGSIYQGDFDTWTFTATQGDYIALSVGTVTQTTAHFAPWIRLVSPTGALLGNSSTQTGASNIAATAPTSEAHTAKLQSQSDLVCHLIRGYMLTLAQRPDAVVVPAGDEAGTMTAGATHPGTISHVFFFTDTSTTEIYTLSLHDALPISQTTAHFAPWIRLVSSTGALLGNSFTQTGASNIAATAPTSGTYTVIIGSYVGGFYDGTGSYLLTLAKGPGAVEVSTGDEGGPMTDEIGRASCM